MEPNEERPPNTDESPGQAVPGIVPPFALKTIQCSHCGSERIKQNVTISQAAEGGYTGLQYRTGLVLVGSEPLLADLCLKCGTVLRLHVKNRRREWIVK